MMGFNNLQTLKYKIGMINPRLLGREGRGFRPIRPCLIARSGPIKLPHIREIEGTDTAALSKRDERSV
jgi:hypothetical protein